MKLGRSGSSRLVQINNEKTLTGGTDRVPIKGDD